MITLVVVLLALDWAALHDILKGEPNLYVEYGILLISMVVFAIMLFMRLRRKDRRASAA